MGCLPRWLSSYILYRRHALTGNNCSYLEKRVNKNYMKILTFRIREIDNRFFKPWLKDDWGRVEISPVTRKEIGNVVGEEELKELKILKARL